MKTIKNRIITFLVALAFAVSGLIAGAQPTFAKSKTSISPPKADFTLQPGQSYRASFTLSNPGDESLKYKSYVTPYSVDGNDQDYAAPNYSKAGKYNTITDWIKLDSEGGELAPGDHTSISYTINVPKDATPGGQYATIAIEEAKDTDNKNGSDISTGFQARSRVAMVIYGAVAGQVQKTGNIIDNNISSFYFNPPLTATSLVENTGNVHQEAEYILQVFPLFSNEEAYTNEEKPTVFTILPETRRFITQSWDGAPSLGIFKVKQTVRFAGNESVTEKVVIICPMWLVFLVIFGIVFLVVYLIARSKMRKGSSSSKPAHSAPAA